MLSLWVMEKKMINFPFVGSNGWLICLLGIPHTRPKSGVSMDIGLLKVWSTEDRSTGLLRVYVR